MSAQRADPQLQHIVATLQDSASPSSCEFRTLYAVRDGVLGVPDPDRGWRSIITEGTLRTEICRLLHDKAGNTGVQRTFLAVSRYFYWPNMSRFITKYVVSCTACHAANGLNRLPVGFSEPVVLPAESVEEFMIDF